MGRKKIEINPLCGERVKKLCKTKKITQAKLAELTGYTAHTISQVASGKIGLSSELADEIAKQYPDISKEWLLGDPDKNMSQGESHYIHFRDSSDRRHALEALLAFTDFQISQSPYTLDGFYDDFFDVTYKGESVAVSYNQLNGVVDTILEIINSVMLGVFRNGLSVDDLISEGNSYAIFRLEEICVDMIDDAKSEDEKEYLDNFRRALIEEIKNYYIKKCPHENDEDYGKNVYPEY